MEVQNDSTLAKKKTVNFLNNVKDQRNSQERVNQTSTSRSLTLTGSRRAGKTIKSKQSKSGKTIKTLANREGEKMAEELLKKKQEFAH